MPITARVEFYDDLTKVSITDEVYGGYCKDSAGNPIDNIVVQNGHPIDFKAVPDDDTGMGSVTIVGTDANDDKVVYQDSYTFNGGNTLLFPKSKAPTPLAVIKRMKNFQEFSDQFLIKR